MDDGQGSHNRTSLNHSRAPAGDQTSRLVFSVEEFGKQTDLSRSLLYEAIRLGELQSVKIRGRRLILADDGIAWLRSHRGTTP
jgi:hypothetical protein